VDGYWQAGPAEDELAERAEERADRHDERRGFGCGAPGFGVFFRGVVDEAPPERFEDDGEEGADADAEEGEARLADGPAAVLGEDYGVGDEAEVEDAVDYRDPMLGEGG
jgi:hypothetical protein